MIQKRKTGPSCHLISHWMHQVLARKLVDIHSVNLKVAFYSLIFYWFMVCSNMNVNVKISVCYF